MIKTLISCSYFAAEQAIKDYFAQTDEIKQQENELLLYCRENYPPIFYQRFAYRIQRCHVNHIIVSSVLASLSELQYEVIIRKYKKREMAAKIAIDLNISITRMTYIERAVQKNIYNMLLYILTVQDVYSPVKIINMLRVIDIRLAFLDENPGILPDVSRDWLASLYICRKKYRLLYSAMQDVIQNADTSLHCNIIAERLRDPALTSKELSALCHVSQNGINRHLRTYEEDMSKYLVG